MYEKLVSKRDGCAKSSKMRALNEERVHLSSFPPWPGPYRDCHQAVSLRGHQLPMPGPLWMSRCRSRGSVEVKVWSRVELGRYVDAAVL